MYRLLRLSALCIGLSGCAADPNAEFRQISRDAHNSSAHGETAAAEVMKSPNRATLINQFFTANFPSREGFLDVFVRALDQADRASIAAAWFSTVADDNSHPSAAGALSGADRSDSIPHFRLTKTLFSNLPSDRNGLAGETSSYRADGTILPDVGAMADVGVAYGSNDAQQEYAPLAVESAYQRNGAAISLNNGVCTCVFNQKDELAALIALTELPNATPAQHRDALFIVEKRMEQAAVVGGLDDPTARNLFKTLTTYGSVDTKEKAALTMKAAEAARLAVPLPSGDTTSALASQVLRQRASVLKSGFPILAAWASKAAVDADAQRMAQAQAANDASSAQEEQREADAQQEADQAQQDAQEQQLAKAFTDALSRK